MRLQLCRQDLCMLLLLCMVSLCLLVLRTSVLAISSELSLVLAAGGAESLDSLLVKGKNGAGKCRVCIYAYSAIRV